MAVVVAGVQQGDLGEDSLEALTLDASAAARVVDELVRSGAADGVFVLDTCQRTEVYAAGADADRTSAAVVRAWAGAIGCSPRRVRRLSTSRADLDAADHLIAVVAGLRSVTTGEPQVVAQVRGALRTAQADGRLGSELNSLVQFALGANKRVRSHASRPTSGTTLAARGLRLASDRVGDLRGRSVLVLGAGAMGSEVAAEARRLGALLGVHTRSPERGVHLVDRLGTAAQLVPDLPAGLAAADVIVSCTSSRGTVVDVAQAAAAAARHGGHQVYVDLARPRDVASEVARLDGVTRIGLGDIGATSGRRRGAPSAEGAASTEAQAWMDERAVAAAGPVIAALHRRAKDAVEAEVARVAARGRLDQATLDDVRHAMRRVAGRLVHTPTVRARQLALEGALEPYEATLSDVFDLGRSSADLAPRASTGTAQRLGNPREVLIEQQQPTR